MGTQQHSSDGPVSVRQVVTDDAYGSRLVPLPADVLPRLAAALIDMGGVDEFLTLGLNRNADGRRRGLAVDSILRSAREHGTDWDAVLGIDLTPAQATQVADQLVDTTLEPAECDAIRCGLFAEPESEMCTEHLARAADPWMTGVA